MHAITNSKPNYAYFINNLAQYLFNLGHFLCCHLKMHVCYIKRIISLGIQYKKCKNGDVLHGFSMWIGLMTRTLKDQHMITTSFLMT